MKRTTPALSASHMTGMASSVTTADESEKRMRMIDDVSPVIRQSSGEIIQGIYDTLDHLQTICCICATRPSGEFNQVMEFKKAIEALGTQVTNLGMEMGIPQQVLKPQKQKEVICPICLDDQSTYGSTPMYAYIPREHVFCQTCSLSSMEPLPTCAICKQNVKEVQRIYL